MNSQLFTPLAVYALLLTFCFGGLSAYSLSLYYQSSQRSAVTTDATTIKTFVIDSIDPTTNSIDAVVSALYFATTSHLLIHVDKDTSIVTRQILRGGTLITGLGPLTPSTLTALQSGMTATGDVLRRPDGSLYATRIILTIDPFAPAPNISGPQATST